MKTKFIYLIGILCFFTNSAIAQVPGITSSNLPLVVINTNGLAIQDAGKIAAKMKLINNGTGNVNKPTDPGNNFDGNIGIEYRGGNSKTTEQNPYNIETRDASGGNLNVSLLGMPAENDWILLSSYDDKTFMRNTLAFQLFRKGSHYAPRTQMVEVIVNNEYQGIYLLAEKIKQDKGRVDISKLTSSDVSGDNLTGGYIFKIDSWDTTNSWQSNSAPFNYPDKVVHYVYDDPDVSNLVTAQKDYLKTTVNSFESVLHSAGFANTTTGYPAWLKLNSFMDYFIVSEVSRNVNAYKKNCYYFKNKNSNDSKIHSGPVWDFDSAWKNIVGCDQYMATDGSGWSYKINDCTTNKTNSNDWIVRLLQDPAFAKAVNTRYFEMRKTFLSTQYLNTFIDSIKNKAMEAQVRHYTKWPILSSSVGTAEVDLQPATYEGQVTKFKAWIQTRLTWLDGHMVGGPNSVSDLVTDFSYRIFPNPTHDLLYLESSSEIQSMEIYSSQGTYVMKKDGLAEYSTQVNVSAFSPGMYLIQLKTKSNQIIHSKLVVD